MGAKVNVVFFKSVNSAKILKWKVKENDIISVGRVIFYYELDKKEKRKYKSTHAGMIKQLIAKEETIIQPGYLFIIYLLNWQRDFLCFIFLRLCFYILFFPNM